MKQTDTKSNVAQNLVEIPFLLLFGGVVYYCIELGFRARSHWTMALCGALCFLAIYKINERLSHRSVFFCALLGAAMITALELILGYILNIRLGWHVWDYSDLPLHLAGQICPEFSLIWFLLCIPVSAISRTMQKSVFYHDAEKN